MTITTKAIRLRFAERTLDLPALQFPAHGLLAIVGPNGAGKSTFLSCLAGSHQASDLVSIDGVSLSSWTADALQRRRAVLLQNELLNFPFLVHEVLAMSGVDIAHPVLQTHIDVLHLAPLLQRDFTALSGGERQRVQLARVMTQALVGSAEQQSTTLLLDEPFNHLDLQFQHAVLEVLQELAQSMCVIVVMHDLRRVLSRIPNTLLIADQRVAMGKTMDVLTEAVIREVFSVGLDQL